MRWPAGPLCCSTLSQEMRSRCPKHPKREGLEAEPAGLCVADSGDRALRAESRHLPIPPWRRTPHPSQSHRDGWRTWFISDFQDGVQSRRLPLPPPPKSTNINTHNNKKEPRLHPRSEPPPRRSRWLAGPRAAFSLQPQVAGVTSRCSVPPPSQACPARVASATFCRR